MDIEARIQRRRRQQDESQLVRDFDVLSPVAHVDDPSDRGPLLERLLDHLDPAFDGRLPPNAYVHGGSGAGKSAAVTPLFETLERLSTGTQSVIHTSTRAPSQADPRFVYVDMRGITSAFTFYHSVLDALRVDSVPEHGVSTEEIKSRLADVLSGTQAGVVIAVDHVDEPNTTGPDELVELFAGLPSKVSWLAVGRDPPEETPLTTYTASVVQVDTYQPQTLVDILMMRATDGLAQGGLSYEHARNIAEWADGNAHDALAALLIAAETAERDDRLVISDADIVAATEEFPDSSVSLGRVLSLPSNKQGVLRQLVDLRDEDRSSVTATTEAISSRPAVDLTPGTVKRFLYEMAELGVVERVQSSADYDKGRPPSRVALRFPPTAFRRLYDLRQ